MACVPGAQVPESLTKFHMKRGPSARKIKHAEENLMKSLELAKEQFQVAAKAGCNLGLKWLQSLEEEEQQLLAESDTKDTLLQS